MKQRDMNRRDRILIVNDNSAELASLIDGLENEGFSVSGTTDPYCALHTLTNGGIDVVLIDLMIPNYNGLQLARKIRDQFPSIRTMLMSDYLLSPVQLAKADTGAIGFMPKPCSFSEVAAFIKEKLNYNSHNKGGIRNFSAAPPPLEVLSLRYSW